MKKIIYFIALLLLLCPTSYSQIISAYYDDLRNSMWIFANLDNRTALYETGLMDCKLHKKTFFNKSARNFIVSKYMPAFIIYSEGKNAKIFDDFSDKTSSIDINFANDIRMIAQSESGKYIAISDGQTVYMLTFEKENLKTIFKKESITNVVSVLPNDENDTLYTAERSGVISVWSQEGKRINSIDTKAVIISMQTDNILGRIIAVTKDGIFALVGENLKLSTVVSDNSITGAYLDNLGRRLIIVTKSGAAIYAYPSMKLGAFFPKVGGKIIETGGKKFIALANGNAINLFDLKINGKIGSILVEYNSVSFYPPETLPSLLSNGITASFIDAVANNKTTLQRENNPQKICAPIAAMVSGVYNPMNMDTANIETAANPYINETKTPQIKAPAKATPPTNPSVAFMEIGNVDDMADIADIQNPYEPNDPISTKDVTSPKIPEPTSMNLNTGSGTPSWVASGKNLPPFNAMAGGKNIEQAFNSAKKIIKNEIVRNIIQKSLNKPEVLAINNDNVKKRFLWQVGSGAAMDLEKNITNEDSWTSPAAIKYVHTKINEDVVEKIALKKFDDELKILNSMDYENYMKIKPNKID